MQLRLLIKKSQSSPFFIKPRWGMGSIALYQANNENELFVLYEKVKKDIQKSVLCEGVKLSKIKLSLYKNDSRVKSMESMY